MSGIRRIVLTVALVGCCAGILWVPPSGGRPVSGGQSTRSARLSERHGDSRMTLSGASPVLAALSGPRLAALAEPPPCGSQFTLRVLNPSTGQAIGSILEGQVELEATATQPVIASSEFQFAPEEPEAGPTSASPGQWSTIEGETHGSEPTRAYTFFDTTSARSPDGLYKLRVLVTNATGEACASVLEDVLIANHSPVIQLVTSTRTREGALHPAGSEPLQEKLELQANLLATPSGSGATTAEAEFQYSPAGKAQWRPLGVEPVSAGSTPLYATQELDRATTLPNDGFYDFRVVSAGGRGTFVSAPERRLLVDNTPPSISFASPGSHLHGRIALSAHATDPGPPSEPQASSGIAAVRFERAHQGEGDWKTVAETSLPTPHGSGSYSGVVSTESWHNGLYQLRASAIDRAGNRAESSAVQDISVENQVSEHALAVTNVAPPANRITILGTVPAAQSPDHETETWAYGFTSAPPAHVNGAPLEYPAEGNQLVLLRQTDAAGWQIADVLRGPNGKAFGLVPPAQLTKEPVQVLGSMTPSGEAWIWIKETQAEYEEGEGGNKIPERTVVGLFHRRPGGPFELDERSTHTLEPLVKNLNPGAELRLAQRSDGNVYGVLIPSPSFPHPHEVTLAGEPGHEAIHISEALEYGYLTDGEWKLKGTPEEVEKGNQGPLPPYALLANHDTVVLGPGDVTGAGELWDALEVQTATGERLMLAHLDEEKWDFHSQTGLDALDLTGALGQPGDRVEPEALKADGNTVWIGANVIFAGTAERSKVVARYEQVGSGGAITNSWCSLPVVNECQEPLGAAAVPDAIFHEQGEVALALAQGSVSVFAQGSWSRVPAPGFGSAFKSEPAHGGGDSFSSASEGWLGGESALGRLSPQGASTQLTPWPVPDRFTLTGVALPPGNQASASESGAVAVGLNGTALGYNASVGWVPAALPPGARHLNLSGVAFAGPSSAFAVGQFGLILHWDGSAWSEDPQSRSFTQVPLNAVAFAPSGQGWAVGAGGIILHYDGHNWSKESAPSGDAGENITSVAVAGSEVFAVAGGNLITLQPGRAWREVDPGLLPPSSPYIRGGLLGYHGLVAGLPDGGVVAAGSSTVLIREGPGQRFQYGPQPLEGIAVALAPFREAGSLRAFVSVARPAFDHTEPPELGGLPAGDGELLRETGTGWQDLSQGQFAGGQISGDGAIKTDPVLAVATGADGQHAWALGGYAGTQDAADQGTAEVLATRATGWQTASIWRYDSTGGVAAPAAQSTSTPSLPAKTGTVSFAFFSGTTCKEECAAAVDAQPNVNLTSAAQDITAYANQPGGPAFAMLGGDARGPAEEPASAPERAKLARMTSIDFSQLPELLTSFGALPVFAARGPRDNIPSSGETGETRPWAEAFAEAPPPFGAGGASPGIAPVSAPNDALTGDVHRYYSFDARQNGGMLRVIVLDNSKGALEKAQREWLEQELSQGRTGTQPHPPVVVVAARPLARQTSGGEGAGDGEDVASLLAREGVLAVFAGNPAGIDEHHQVPEHPEPGLSQIPEYEGASLGYQQPANNGVLWYLVSVDTRAREVHVSAVPILGSLALKPVDGLTVARSLTLQFEAVGRRPPGSLATLAGQAPFPGYENYVGIPTPSCGERPCVAPTYSFASSDPAIANFVEASAPGSPYPALDPAGHPIASSASGLLCGYKPGTTTVSVTAGLRSYSLPVTVKPGGVGAPCDVGVPPSASRAERVNAISSQSPIKGGLVPPPPAVAPGNSALPTSVAVAPAPPAPAPPPAAPPPPSSPLPPPPPAKPAPPEVTHTPPPTATLPRPLPASPPSAEPPSTPPPESLSVPPVVVPTPTPPVEPIPPGASGYAQSPSAAERREKARKQASQSAFALRLLESRSQATARPLPANSGSGPAWFYAAVALGTLLALILTARGLPGGPRSRPAPALLHSRDERNRRRR